MPPAEIVSLLSLAAAIGLYRESRKKDMIYKVRWISMSALFIYNSVIYGSVWAFDLSADVRAPWIRWGILLIVGTISLFSTLDLLEEWKK